MALQAVIRAGLYSDSNAFYVGAFGIPHSFLDRVAFVSRKGVVQISDKVVPVVFGEGHECSAHYNEFDFFNTVTQLFQLQHHSLVSL